MKRARRTRILVEGDSGLLERMAAQIERLYQPQVVRAPEKSLVMAQAEDSVAQSPFYAGEVLISECTVKLGPAFGFGALLGEQADKAYRLAIVDAAYRAGLAETKEWTTLLEAEEKNMLRRQAKEQMLAFKTKVEFRTMEASGGKRE